MRLGAGRDADRFPPKGHSDVDPRHYFSKSTTAQTLHFAEMNAGVLETRRRLPAIFRSYADLIIRIIRLALATLHPAGDAPSVHRYALSLQITSMA